MCVCVSCVLGVGVCQRVHFIYSTDPKPTRLQLKIIRYLLPSERAHMHCAKPSLEEVARLSLELAQPGLEIYSPLEPQVL